MSARSSRSENAQRAAANFSNHDFDFGQLGASFSKSSASSSLNAQKQVHQANPCSSSGAGSGSGSSLGASWSQKPTPLSSSSAPRMPSSSSSSSSSPSGWSWQSTSSGGSMLNAAPRSMVGDISGKSWGSMDTMKTTPNKSGLVGGLSRGASPDLFGDLVSASRSSTSLNKRQQQTSQGSESSTFLNLDVMAAPLSRGMPMKDVKVSKAKEEDEMGDFVSAKKASSSSQDVGWAAFEALTSKSKAGYADQAKGTSNVTSGDDPFGDFQGTSAARHSAANVNVDPFAASSAVNLDRLGSSSKSVASSDGFFNLASNNVTSAKTQTSYSNSINLDPFAFLNGSKMVPPQPVSTQNVQPDLFESVMGKIASMSTGSKAEDPPFGPSWSYTKPQSGITSHNVLDDWGMETGFGGDDGGTTTELDGLPPPPAGVSAALAKDKGLEFYKQGQFADAIKWLSWAEVLLEKKGESSHIIEVLTCKSSCLKEAGEYKKAVADCTKVIELDTGNMAILLQRALLYESMEKYKLGVADLKEVLKREPQNRLANNTLARLKKMVD